MAHKLGPHWREAPDSWVETQRRVSVANPRRSMVGAKNATQQPAALGTRTCQVFTEGRGNTNLPSDIKLVEEARQHRSACRFQ